MFVPDKLKAHRVPDHQVTLYSGSENLRPRAVNLLHKRRRIVTRVILEKAAPEVPRRCHAFLFLTKHAVSVPGHEVVENVTRSLWYQGKGRSRLPRLIHHSQHSDRRGRSSVHFSSLDHDHCGHVLSEMPSSMLLKKLSMILNGSEANLALRITCVDEVDSTVTQVAHSIEEHPRFHAVGRLQPLRDNHRGGHENCNRNHRDSTTNVV
mmetsp:Transcript_6075/g.17012  ORF Transcript_6075/g.17012 Transcript_6075/m.17012 type:complete len:208 (+) Transcript_6075:130-753(+)